MELVCEWTVYNELLPNNNLVDFVFDKLSTESKLGTPEFNDSWAIEWDPFNIWSIKIKALHIQSWIGSNTLNYVMIDFNQKLLKTSCNDSMQGNV